MTNPNSTDQRIDHAPTVIAFGPRPPLAQPGWIIMNAPRPLWGSVAWEGEWNCGALYCAIDPADPDSGEMIANNLSLRAKVIRYEEPAAAKKILRHHYRHIPGLRDQEKGNILIDIDAMSDDEAAAHAREIVYGGAHAALMDLLRGTGADVMDE